jgi:hypothetical protein
MNMPRPTTTTTLEYASTLDAVLWTRKVPTLDYQCRRAMLNYHDYRALHPLPVIVRDATAAKAG